MSWKLGVLLSGVSEKEQNTLVFAAQELKKYLSKVTDESIMICESDSAEKSGIRIGINLSPEIPEVSDPRIDDAIMVDVMDREGVITGSNARSVLIAVYRYLREIGFCFIRPGKSGEKYPEKIQRNRVLVNEAATSRYRGICIEGSEFYESIEEIIDWLPKVAMNGYDSQFFVPMIFFKRWYTHAGYGMVNPYLPPEPLTEEDVRGMAQSLAREVEKRSLIYINVGHGWTCKPFGMPALGWEPVDPSTLPEGYEQYLALVGGKRELRWGVPMNTNLCFGNESVQDKIVDCVVQYCMENKNVDSIQFALSDGTNNHCECEKCKHTRPSDFYVQILNKIDRKLTDLNIPVRIFTVIYVDLLWPPETERIQNKNRFILMYCPISRSYTTPLTVETTAKMTPYVRNKLVFPGKVDELAAYLKGWRDQFDGEYVVFDYYFMWDCYKDLGSMGTARMIYDDIRNYEKMRFTGLISCQSQRVFSPTALGMNIMARTLWNRECDFETECNDILHTEFGEDWEFVRNFLSELSRYSLPEVTRLEKPIATPENAAMYQKGIACAGNYMRIIDTHIGKGSTVEQVSWKNLKFHVQLSVLLLKAYTAIATDPDADVGKLWTPIEDFVNLNEWEMRHDFDVFEFKYTIGRLLPKFVKAERGLELGN